MTALSFGSNFSVSSRTPRSNKIRFASAELDSTKPTETKSADAILKPAEAAPPVSPEPVDTLVKSSEKTSPLPTTTEGWTKHVLAELPETERTPALEEALHAHFKKMEQIKAPLQQEIRNVIGPHAKEMSERELAIEATKVIFNDPSSEAAEKIRKVQFQMTEAVMPVEHAFLKGQNEAVQKAYFDSSQKSMQIAMTDILKNAAPNLALDEAKPKLPAGYMDELRKAFLKNDPMNIATFMRQSTENGTKVFTLVKQFMTKDNELVKTFQVKRDELAKTFEAERTELATKFEAELGELSKKFRAQLQESNPFGEVFQKFLTKKL